jgi:hypothetical protein
LNGNRREDWQGICVENEYAAYTKGTTALLCAMLGAAEDLGVRELACQFSRDDSNRPKAADRRAAKAWRFAGEMEEVCDLAERNAGWIHDAAADIYRRLADLGRARILT